MTYVQEHKREIITNYFNNDYLKSCMKELRPLPDIAFYTTTAGVNQRCLKLCKRVFEYKPIKMKINPLLARQLCFQNSVFMKQIYLNASLNYQVVLGVNVTACPCGCKFTMELHAVVYNKDTCEYEDNTTDFAGETHKWFIPLRHYDDEAEFSFYVKVLRSNNLTLFHNWDSPHMCYDGITYDPTAVLSHSADTTIVKEYYNQLMVGLNL